jgi:hypothetical protein
MDATNRTSGVEEPRWGMPDALQERIQPSLPARPAHPLGCRRPRVDDRRAMDAIFFATVIRRTLFRGMQSGSCWRESPATRCGAGRWSGRIAGCVASAASSCAGKKAANDTAMLHLACACSAFRQTELA